MDAPTPGQAPDPLISPVVARSEITAPRGAESVLPSARGVLPSARGVLTSARGVLPSARGVLTGAVSA
jgi:hypothetical protein